MNCERVKESLSALLDGELSEGEVAAVRAHVEQCADCAREWETLRQVSALYRELEDPEPPAELEARVLAAIHERPAATEGWARKWFSILLRPRPAFAFAVCLVGVVCVSVYTVMTQWESRRRAGVATAPFEEQLKYSANSGDLRGRGAELLQRDEKVRAKETPKVASDLYDNLETNAPEARRAPAAAKPSAAAVADEDGAKKAKSLLGIAPSRSDKPPLSTNHEDKRSLATGLSGAPEIRAVLETSMKKDESALRDNEKTEMAPGASAPARAPVAAVVPALEERPAPPAGVEQEQAPAAEAINAPVLAGGKPIGSDEGRIAPSTFFGRAREREEAAALAATPRPALMQEQVAVVPSAAPSSHPEGWSSGLPESAAPANSGAAGKPRAVDTLMQSLSESVAPATFRIAYGHPIPIAQRFTLPSTDSSTSPVIETRSAVEFSSVEFSAESPGVVEVRLRYRDIRGVTLGVAARGAKTPATPEATLVLRVSDRADGTKAETVSLKAPVTFNAVRSRLTGVAAEGEIKAVFQTDALVEGREFTFELLPKEARREEE